MKGWLSVLVIGTIVIFDSFLDCGRGVLAQGKQHYCDRGPSSSVEEIKGETEGHIYTLYPGDSHYQNNQKCMWMIDAGPNNRVEVTILSSNLQWAHKSAICPGYDHVAIKDVPRNTSSGTGASSQESILLQWCGYAQPLGAVSSGRFIRVEFRSDKQNPYQYTGVHLHFKTFPSSECAPSWTNSSEGFCYKLLNQTTDWSSGQRVCNTGGANLASLLSQREQDFVHRTFSSSVGMAWIGLTDIVYEGGYQWIDRSQYTYSRFDSSHTPNKYLRCAVMGMNDGFWQLKDCNKGRLKPLCKAKRGSKTVIFPIPQRRADESDSEIPVGRVVAIVVSVFALVLLLIVGVIIYCKLKASRQKSAYESPKPPSSRRAVALQDVAVENRQPTAPPQENSEEPVMTNPESRMLAPPSYDEALTHPVVSSSRS